MFFEEKIIAGLLAVILVMSFVIIHYKKESIFLNKYLSSSARFLIKNNLLGKWHEHNRNEYYLSKEKGKVNDNDD